MGINLNQIIKANQVFNDIYRLRDDSISQGSPQRDMPIIRTIDKYLRYEKESMMYILKKKIITF